MADVFDKAKRSKIMSKIRSKNTKPERILFEYAKELWHEGFRYRKHDKRVTGKPDLTFPKYNLAVFLDSEFWHGKNFEELRERLPKDYWRDKIARNIARDKEVNAHLKDEGWKVIRFWSKEIRENPENVISSIRQALLEAASAQ